MGFDGTKKTRKRDYCGCSVCLLLYMIDLMIFALWLHGISKREKRRVSTYCLHDQPPWSSSSSDLSLAQTQEREMREGGGFLFF